jgi:hypothetical protein
MAVQPASLEVLEKAAVPPAQARAIVQAIEIEIAGAKDTSPGTKSVSYAPNSAMKWVSCALSCSGLPISSRPTCSTDGSRVQKKRTDGVAPSPAPGAR